MGRPPSKDGPGRQVSTRVRRAVYKRIEAIQRREGRPSVADAARVLLELGLDVQNELGLDTPKVLQRLRQILRASTAKEEKPVPRRVDIK